MREQSLIQARDHLLGIAHREFGSSPRNPVYLAGFPVQRVAPRYDALRSHFRSFVKIDIFYFSEDDLRPSPWYSLPVRILFDRNGALERLIPASADLRFEVTGEDLDFSISKGIAAAHEAFRRTQRGELLFAQTLLGELRFHMIQADDWLFDRTPRTQLFSKFDHRGSPADWKPGWNLPHIHTLTNFCKQVPARSDHL